jgi:hypothetical protein
MGRRVEASSGETGTGGCCVAEDVPPGRGRPHDSSIRSWIPARDAASSLLQGRSPPTTSCSSWNNHNSRQNEHHHCTSRGILTQCYGIFPVNDRAVSSQSEVNKMQGSVAPQLLIEMLVVDANQPYMKIIKNYEINIPKILILKPSALLFGVHLHMRLLNTILNETYVIIQVLITFQKYGKPRNYPT